MCVRAYVRVHVLLYLRTCVHTYEHNHLTLEVVVAIGHVWHVEKIDTRVASLVRRVLIAAMGFCVRVRVCIHMHVRAWHVCVCASVYVCACINDVNTWP